MAASIVISLDKDLGEMSASYFKAKSGKALAREIEKLDYASRVCKVPAITSMLSESHAALIEQLKAEGFDPSKMRLPAEQWYAAGEGLTTVRGLHAYVSEHLNDFKQPNPVLRDLKAAEALLAAAETAGAKFHFIKSRS